MPLSDDERLFILQRIEQLLLLGVPGFVKVKVSGGGRVQRVYTGLSEGAAGGENQTRP